MSIFTGLFGKLAGSIFGKAIGGFFSSYGLYIIIGSVITALVAVVIYVHGAEKAKARVPALEQRLEEVTADYIDKQAANQAVINKCLDANTANEQEAARQAENTEKATAAAIAMAAEMDIQIGRIRSDSNTLRNRDTECRTLDSALPNWFTDGLRD